MKALLLGEALPDRYSQKSNLLFINLITLVLCATLYLLVLGSMICEYVTLFF